MLVPPLLRSRFPAEGSLRDGAVIALGYDDLDRLTSKTLPGDEIDAAYGYDALDRLVSATQGGQALSFAYNSQRHCGQLCRRWLSGIHYAYLAPTGAMGAKWDLLLE